MDKKLSLLPKRPILFAERGSALVEFSLVLPMMLLVVTGIFSFGIAINNYLELTNGVALAAQQVSINRSSTTDPCALAAQTLDQAAPFLSQSNITLTTVVYTGASDSPSPNSFSGTSCSSSSTSTGAAGDLTEGDPVQITATYPCALAGYGFNFPCKLTTQVTEIVQ